MKVSRFAFRLLPALIVGCGMASASTIIDVTAVDTSRGAYNLVIRENNTTDVQLYFAGVIMISVTEGSQTFLRDSLCVDLFTDIFLSQQYNTNLLRPDQMPQKNLERASWLVDNYLLPAQNAPASSTPNPYWVTSPVQGMAIQLAIWDIVHDGGDGFGAGLVQATTVDTGLGVTPTNVVSLAQQYELFSLDKANDQAFVYNNVDMGNNQPAQMLIGPQFADGGPQPVPEPRTLLPMGLALIALSLGLRRRIRKQA
jgi:hypothetical protein